MKKFLPALTLALCLFMIAQSVSAVQITPRLSANLASSSQISGSTDGMSKPNSALRNLIDGDANSFWDASGLNYCQLDLKRAVNISTVKLVFRNSFIDNVKNHTDIEISVSNDPEFRTNVVVLGKTPSNQEECSEFYKTGFSVNYFGTETYRYVRVSKTANAYIILGDIEVYETLVEDDTSGIPAPVELDYEKDQHTVARDNLLTALGILTKEDTTDLSENATVTRADAARLIYSMLNLKAAFVSENIFEDVPSNYWAAPYIDTLHGIGIVNGVDGHRFVPEKIASTEDFINMVVTALGYAELDNDNSSIMSWAIGLGVIKGIETYGELTWQTAAQIVYNSLFVKLLNEKYITIDGIPIVNKYYSDNECSLMEKVFGVYKGIGILTGNKENDLYTGTGVGSGKISIDGYIYGSNISDLGNYIGYKVEYYIMDNNGEKNVISLYPTTKNTVLKIDINDTVLTDKRTVKYEDGTKIKTANISVSADYIYNGKLLKSFSNKDYIFDNGYLTLVDNNDDGCFDVVYITAFETIITNRVSIDDGTKYTVFGEYGEILNIDYNSKNSSINVYTQDNEKTSPNGIENGDVLLVEKSKDGSVVRIWCSDKYADIQVLSVETDNTDKTVTATDETRYTVSRYWQRKILDTSLNVDNFRVDESMRLYFDKNGEVAYAKKVRKDTSEIKTTLQYGYLIKAACEKGVSRVLKFKIFNDSNKIEVYDSDKKINFNGGKTNDFEKVLNLIQTTASNGTNPYAQLIKFRLNDSGKIVELYTNGFVGDFGNNRLTLDVDHNANKHYYLSSIKSFVFANTSTPNFYADDDTVIFSVPLYTDATKDIFEDESYYHALKVSNYTYTQADYVDAYNLGQARTAKCVVRYDELAFGNDAAKYDPFSTVLLVDKITSSLNADGEDCKTLQVYNGGAYVEYEVSTYIDINNLPFQDKDNVTLMSELKCGDVIRCLIVNDKILGIHKVFDISNINSNIDSAYYGSNSIPYRCSFVFGVITSTFGEFATVNVGGKEEVHRISASSAFLYEKNNKYKLSAISYEEIGNYVNKKILIGQSHVVPTMVLVIN